MKFKLTNTNRFYLQGTNNRFLHLATIHLSTREFLLMLDKRTNQVYIEEITGGHLIEIKDDSLWEELNKFCLEKRLMEIRSDLPLYEQAFMPNKK